MDPLKEQRKKVLDELAAISQAAKLGSRPFTDDEKKRIAELQAQDDALLAKIKAAEEDLKTQQAIDARLAAASTPAPRRTDASAGEPLAKVPAQAKGKTVKLASGIEVEDRWLRDPSKGFDSHVDFLRSVMNAGRGRMDPRLRPLAVERRGDGDDDISGGSFGGFLCPAAFTPGAPRLGGLYNSRGHMLTAGSDEAGTYSDPYGGILVGPGAFRPELLKVMAEGDPMGAYTTKIPMETASVSIPARVDKNHTSSVSGGLRVYRRGETQTSSSSRMELEEVELKASALFGLAYATEELLARSLISFLAVLQAGFSDEFNAKLIRERLEGTGVGQYEGVLNSDCIVSVAKETGQAADTILYENVIKMRARCWGYGNAIWLANHDTLPQLMTLNQSIGSGGVFLWQPSAREDHPDMLLGRPLYFSEFCPKLGDTGDLLLGNWKEYLEGQLSPMQNAESMHVRFVEHERTFKFWTENAGKCWWRSALTPAKSSSTLSPFVKLDAR